MLRIYIWAKHLVNNSRKWLRIQADWASYQMIEIV